MPKTDWDSLDTLLDTKLNPRNFGAKTNSKKCEKGCKCGRHRYYGNGSKGKCESGCKCGRHSVTGRPRTPWKKRFYAKVNRNGPRVSWMHTRCWVWTAACSNGYAMFSANTNGLGSVRAAKWLWESINGPTPEGKELDHLCRNRACIRPSHLEAVTKKENWRRSRPYRKIEGEENPAAKLTNQQVRKILERYQEALSHHPRQPVSSGRHIMNFRKVALEYGVSTATISHIINRRTWKEVMPYE